MAPQSSFEAAFALHASGALAEAEAAYRVILVEEPHHVQAMHYLGVVLYQSGNAGEGVPLILQALELEPGQAARYNDLGNILFAQGDYANAAAVFRIALDVAPHDANVWNNYGSVLHRQQQLDAAETAYRKALETIPDFAPALNNLATLLSEQGRDEEASLLACRAFVQPPLEGKHPRMLGIAYYRLGLLAQAADSYREWLRLEPDNPVARHHLAACTQEAVPARAPDEFVKAVFDDMAAEFDHKLTGKLEYRGPQIIANLLEALPPPDHTLDVLDGGCGTGLCAPILAPYARHLAGVDLSPGMVAKASARGQYNTLTVAELTAYLQQNPETFDLIALADTLIYFGDLSDILAAAATALRAGGHIVFTVEATQDNHPFMLGPSGRYRHRSDHVAQALAASGFALLEMRDVVLRHEFCQPTAGFGVLARRQVS
ncbi:MAG: tetratricopeptide repeat protein [Betaproteobacteria bacterium]|nr:tetratricopeptide repeat protein [Betaproteobacteria bacterium]MDE2622747.1 tetratricopeptide repeat protein [Betaproteobacteria bacterium]